MSQLSRREILIQGAAAAAASFGGPSFAQAAIFNRRGRRRSAQLVYDSKLGKTAGPAISFGLVTYKIGSEWDLPTLIANCEKTDTLGVELRTTHKHGVESRLSASERAAVKKRFADSRVKLIGIGSDTWFDYPDPATLQKSINEVKEFIKLSHDVGGSGVKVKPNDFHKDIPHEKTIAQIGAALLELGKFGAEYNQQIRLEVHGQCAELPTIKAIMDAAQHPNVKVCWNSNPTDLNGKGLEYNFDLVKDRLGATCHVHRLNDKKYPYAKLMELLVKNHYQGCVMLEDGHPDSDQLAELANQRKLFDELLAKAQA